MTLETSAAWNCYGCENAGKAQSGAMVARMYRAGDSERYPRRLRYLCPDCLFNAIRDGEFESYIKESSFRFTGFKETNETHSWSCYHCNKGKQRVGYLPGTLANDIQFLCPDCLFSLVVEGRIAVSTSGKPKEEAAPIGPTATYNKETGAVEIDGTTFRW